MQDCENMIQNNLEKRIAANVSQQILPAVLLRQSVYIRHLLRLQKVSNGRGI